MSGAMLLEATLGFAAGAALGGIFFGTLWLTIRRIADAPRPGLLLAVSYVARLALLGAGLYGVVRLGGGLALVAALAGLLVARRFAIRSIAPGADGTPTVRTLDGSV